MKVYINEQHEIKAVNSTTDNSLTELEITDGTFDGWADYKIKCYKVNVDDGKVTMMTPYIDTRIINDLARIYADLKNELNN